MLSCIAIKYCSGQRGFFLNFRVSPFSAAQTDTSSASRDPCGSSCSTTNCHRPRCKLPCTQRPRLACHDGPTALPCVPLYTRWCRSFYNGDTKRYTLSAPGLQGCEFKFWINDHLNIITPNKLLMWWVISNQGSPTYLSRRIVAWSSKITPETPEENVGNPHSQPVKTSYPWKSHAKNEGTHEGGGVGGGKTP